MLSCSALLLLAAPVAAQPAPDADRPVLLQAVGDLNLAAAAERTMAEKGFAWAFEGTRALLAEGDVNIANLETPATARLHPFRKKFTFRMAEASLDAIRGAGFGLLTLANNHTGDQGPEGLLDTLAALDRRGIAHAGAGTDLASARAPAVVVVRGTRVAVLAYSLTYPSEFWANPRRPGTAYGDEAHVREDVAKARTQADVVIAIFHWGREKHSEPLPYQRRLARASVEAGADAVLGHHPHVLQGVEVIEGRPVVYSLGNYAFGSGAPLGDSALARLVIRGGRVAELELIPLNVLNRETRFNPRVADGGVRTRILATLQRLGAALGTRGEVRDGRLHVALAPAARRTSSTAPGKQD